MGTMHGLRPESEYVLRMIRWGHTLIRRLLPACSLPLSTTPLVPVPTEPPPHTHKQQRPRRQHGAARRGQGGRAEEQRGAAAGAGAEHAGGEGLEAAGGQERGAGGAGRELPGHGGGGMCVALGCGVWGGMIVLGHSVRCMPYLSYVYPPHPYVCVLSILQVSSFLQSKPSRVELAIKQSHRKLQDQQQQQQTEEKASSSSGKGKGKGRDTRSKALTTAASGTSALAEHVAPAMVRC